MRSQKKKKKNSLLPEMTGERPRAFVGDQLNFAAAEAYKLMRTNLMFTLSEETNCRVLGLTSAMRGEGKSTTSLNLAYSLAETGQRVLFIEADMRLPVLAKTLDIRRAPGLSNVLAGLTSDVWEAIQPSGLRENLHMISSGDIPPNPSELLASERLSHVLEEYKKKYDFILFDLPPVNAVPDGLVLSKNLQGMIIVVRKDYSEKPAVEEVVRKLNFLGIKILGFVVTRGTLSSKKYKKYGGSYRYGYGYDRARSENQ